MTIVTFPLAVGQRLKHVVECVAEGKKIQTHWSLCQDVMRCPSGSTCILYLLQ